MEKNEAEEIIRCFSMIIKQAPEDQKIREDFAQIYISLKRYDEAFELDPKNKSILDSILSDIFKYIGECKKCGGCCKGVQISIGEGRKFISSKEEFEEQRKKNPAIRRWMISGKKNKDLAFYCKFLSPEGKCNDYENRPEDCRRFPKYMTKPPSGCGYKRFINLSPYQIKNIALLKIIYWYAEKMGLYEEMRNLLKIGGLGLTKPQVEI